MQSRVYLIDKFKEVHNVLPSHVQTSTAIEVRMLHEDTTFDDSDYDDELDSELDRVEFQQHDLDDSQKKRTLFACLLALTIGNMMINNVVSFLPTYIEQKVWVSIEGY